MKREEYPSWHDCLGQAYKPGDLVAVATISNKSPQLVIGRVVRINKFDSSGKEIVKKVRFRGNSIEEPNCTVVVDPLIDARGFHRGPWSGAGKKKLVTYQFPENIVKVTPDPMVVALLTRTDGDDAADAAAGLQAILQELEGNVTTESPSSAHESQ